jgi:hypothetical protein
MTLPEHASRQIKRTSAALFAGVILAGLTAAVFWVGVVLEFEYPYWPTFWQASHTNSSDSIQGVDLIRVRSMLWSRNIGVIAPGVISYVPMPAYGNQGDYQHERE